MLVKYGADTKHIADGGLTVLHNAAREMNEEILKCALETNDIEALDEDFNTPFLAACSTNNKHNMRYLISHGCNVNVKNKSKKGAFHLMSANNSIDALTEFLKTHPYSDDQDKNGRTPLHLAAKYNNLKIVEMLLNNGANKDTTDKFNKLPTNLTTSRTIKKLLSPKKNPKNKRKKRTKKSPNKEEE